VGETSDVAVNSKVGGGVFVGGSGVKEAERVGVSLATAGWKGVGVREESGAGVTSTSGEGTPSAVGREQAARIRVTSANRRGVFISSLSNRCFVCAHAVLVIVQERDRVNKYS
jgi:hypothetical protein